MIQQTWEIVIDSFKCPYRTYSGKCDLLDADASNPMREKEPCDFHSCPKVFQEVVL